MCVLVRAVIGVDGFWWYHFVRIFFYQILIERKLHFVLIEWNLSEMCDPI